MAEYYCVMKGKYFWWVSPASFSSEEYAREYASDFKSELAAIVAANTGIRPPVGMRAEEASHEWRERLVSPYGVMPFVFEDQLEPRA